MTDTRHCYRPWAVLVGLLWAFPAAAQLDQTRAATFFQEAAALCEREGGRLWGVSLCGPMVFADPVTKSIATNQPAPAAPPPPAFGFANAAMNWGGTRWTAISWPFMLAMEQGRGQLMMHELFHRIQPQLGLFLPDGPNDHLDTLDGRYWMQLEWRALAKALGASGAERTAAVRDATAFRFTRRRLFAGAAESERVMEINEGLAQYTATVVAAASGAEVVASAIDQLSKGAQEPTFVRQFAYSSGAAYGILLDAYNPGWTRRIKSADDLGQLLVTAVRIRPAENADAAAKLYGGPEVRTSEEKREAEQKLRVAGLRRRFVESPVIVLPPSRGASFSSVGMTPIPGAGTIYPTFRTAAEWGTLEAASVLMAPDRSKLTLPAPASVEGTTLKGDGWALTIAPGWAVRPGTRPGDFQLVKEP